MKLWLHLVPVLLTVKAFCMEPCHSHKVLLLPCVTFDSHLKIYGRIAEALTQLGHDPVLLLHEGRAVQTVIPPNLRVQRYHGVFSTRNVDDWIMEKHNRVFQGRMASLELFAVIEKFLDNCDLILGNSMLLQQLQSEGFDLVLIDPHDTCGFILAHFLDVKYAVFSTAFWFPAEIGTTSPVAYVPEFNSLMTDHMGFVGRTWNLLVFIINRLAVRLVILPRWEHLMAKHGIEPQKSIMSIIHGTSIFFLANDVVLDFPRPTLPHVILAGGILTETAKPLPGGRLRHFVDTADAGVVVVCFGSCMHQFPQDFLETIAKAVARLPQRIVWKLSGPQPHNLGTNTLLMEWLPLNDLLGHPNVKALVSHCGLNSAYEAMYHGVPIVGIPFFGDQYDVMTRIQAKGMGILVRWYQMNENGLYEALSTVISNPSFRKTAKKMSHQFRDKPMPALNTTVFWLEYIFRHDGAPFLRPSVYRLAFYEYYCLDILAFLILSAGGILYVVYRLRLWYRRSDVNAADLNGNCLSGYNVDGKKVQ